MKTKLLSLLFAIAASIGTIFAERVLIGELYYDLNTSEGTAMVTYQQEISKTNYSGLTIATIPESVEYNSINYSVSSIGDRAFCSCNSLTSITIPNSITSIGVQAFMNCAGLTDVTLPLNIRTIKESAFNGCTGLTSIEIPDNVTNIEVSAFSCSNLTSVTLNSNAVLSKTYTTSFNLKSIFGAQVTEYFIGNYVTSIGDCAFYECSGITSIEIPNNITRIGNGSFYGCSSLTSVTIPNSVTSIGGCAFQACSSLTSVEIPNTVTSIESYAFESCTGLDSVKIPSSVASIGYYAFYGCSSLTSVTIPNSVTSIGNNVFYGCSNLTSVYCESATPATIQSNTFPTSAIFYVPNCAYTAFHNAPTWKDFNIVPVDVNLAVMNNTGGVVVENCGQMEIEAIPYIGYQFKRWQDGNKENPRKYTLTQTNRNFIAEFEVAKYQITLSCDANQGSITGDQGKFVYESEHTIEAVAKYGYHFTQWSDGQTENPRTFVLEQDTTFTAEFAKNTYSIETHADAELGSVSAPSEGEYLDEITMTAEPEEGYRFSQWNDGNTDNPRTFVLTQDTVFTAQFVSNVNYSCGNDWLLTWSYDADTKTLTISGEGAFNENMECSTQARAEMETLVFAEGVTSIGASAFANCATLQTLVLPTTVKKINENAFYNCESLTVIYNHRPTPTNALSTAFDGVDKFECVLFVPATSIDLYKSAAVWRDFYDIQAIQDEATAIGLVESSAMHGGSGCTKLLRDGQLLIFRDGKNYTVQGQEVR